MNSFCAAIFDLDGTLLDSMDVWEQISIEFLAKRSIINIPSDYIKEIYSRSFEESAIYTIVLFSLGESPNEVIAEWNRMGLDKYSHEIALKPHAKDYLEKLRGAGTVLAVATSLPNVLYEPVLRNNRIYDWFNAFCSTDEVSRGKEHPDVFLLASQKIKISPQNCVVFEDTLPGIRSAKQAGMMVYGMFDTYSEPNKDEIINIADGYLYDFSNAPVPKLI